MQLKFFKSARALEVFTNKTKLDFASNIASFIDESSPTYIDIPNKFIFACLFSFIWHMLTNLKALVGRKLKLISFTLHCNDCYQNFLFRQFVKDFNEAKRVGSGDSILGLEHFLEQEFDLNLYSFSLLKIKIKMLIFCLLDVDCGVNQDAKSLVAPGANLEQKAAAVKIKNTILEPKILGEKDIIKDAIKDVNQTDCSGDIFKLLLNQHLFDAVESFFEEIAEENEDLSDYFFFFMVKMPFGIENGIKSKCSSNAQN